MKIPKYIFILIIVTILSCQRNNNDNIVFKPPKIVNSKFEDNKKAIPHETEHVSQVFPVFAGKYKFQDKIDVNPIKEDKLMNKDLISGYSSVKKVDSISIHGLEIIVDYKTSVKYSKYYERDSTIYKYYPVYFVNSTNSDKLFIGKDSYVFGIQEALKKQNSRNLRNRNWLPIEGKGFDFCGNGYWGLVVHPKEFVLILMRKYKGNYNTKMRVRFRFGENILVSKPFEGKINKNQFSIKDSSYIGQQLKESDGEAASWLFNGAEPKKEQF